MSAYHLLSPTRYLQVRIFLIQILSAQLERRFSNILSARVEVKVYFRLNEDPNKLNFQVKVYVSSWWLIELEGTCLDAPNAILLDIDLQSKIY